MVSQDVLDIGDYSVVKNMPGVLKVMIFKFLGILLRSIRLQRFIRRRLFRFETLRVYEVK